MQQDYAKKMFERMNMNFKIEDGDEIKSEKN